MTEADKVRTFSRCARVYRFSLPHWRLIIAATVAMFLYTSTYTGLLIIVRPILEAVDVASPGKSGTATQTTAAQTAPRPVPGWTKHLPAGVRRTVQKAMHPGPEQLTGIAIVIGFVFAPLIGLFAFCQIYLQDRVQWVIIADIRQELFARLVQMPIRFFDEYRIGELISRMTNDVRASQVALKFLFGDVILNPLKILAGLIVALSISWRLSLLCFVGIPIIAVTLKHFGRRIHRHARESLKKLADLTEAMNQMFSGIRVVKAFQMEQAEVGEFRVDNDKQLQQATKLVKNRGFASAAPEFIYAVIIAVFIFIGHRMLRAELITWGALIAFGIAAVYMMQPIRTLSRSYSRLPEALAATDRLFELIEKPIDTADVDNAIEIEGVREGVQFDHVCFAYKQGQPILKGIDFFAPAGRMIAVVGETGAGKSTLLDLVPRFHDVTDGAILVDGVDIRNIKRQSLLSQIAIVGQHPFLFNRSIRDNISYGRQGATQAEIEQAARQAGIHDFVESLPEKYDTWVGERGGMLSGGQRQCLTIARAILKDAPLLILDEATSNLDAGSEKLVHEALNNLVHGRTTFVIAHRLSTVREADMIVVIRRGSLIELGTHDELIVRQGEYYRLYTLQFRREADDGRAEPTPGDASPDGKTDAS